MEREQIIKALECCGAYKCGHPCQECPYFTTNDDEICSNRMAQDALALIKQLTEENERLRNWCENKIVLDNDELKEVKTACLERIKLDVKRIKTDTVRKFAKRLEEYYNELSGKTFPPLVAYHIEQIEKEFWCDSETQ